MNHSKAELCRSCSNLKLKFEACNSPQCRHARKGSFFDLPVIGVIAFGCIIGIILTYMIGTQMFSALPSTMQSGIPATFFNVFLNMNGLMDGILVMIFVTLGLASAILARQIQSPSPAFWGIGIILVVVLNMVWVMLANVFIGFLNSGTAFATAAQAFPYTSFIVQYYPLFMIFQAAFIAWAQWGKPSTGGSGYYQ